MATVIYGGSRELNLLISGEPHRNTLEYLRHQADRIATYVGNAGSEWANRAIESFNYFSSDASIRQAKAAISKVTSYFQSDVIRELQTLSDFQNAKPLMQRFVMADPVIRKLYHAGRTDGYRSSGYVDPYPGRSGEDDYNYRRVMEGRVQMLPSSEESPDGDFFFVHYPEDLEPDDKELTVLEQDMIISSWRQGRYLLANGLDDPLSSDGGKL